MKIKKLSKEDMKEIKGGASVSKKEYCKQIMASANRNKDTWSQSTWDAWGQSWEKHCQ